MEEKRGYINMLKKEGRYGKSLSEPVSIRRPAISGEEWPEILDSDGQPVSNEPDMAEPSDYTFDAKIHRILLTRRNRALDENIYERDDQYYVHFRMDMDFIKISDEILWHKHVEKQEDNNTPDVMDLQDTNKGVLEVQAVEEHRGTQRLYCRLYDIA